MYGQAAIFNTEHSINGQQQKAKSVDSSSSFSLITSTHPPQSNATKFNQMYRNEDGRLDSFLWHKKCIVFSLFLVLIGLTRNNSGKQQLQGNIDDVSGC
jgi:hypothetical protein